MRLIFSLLFTLVLFTSIQAQAQLSSTQWQEDLRFFQQKIHADYPFLFKLITAKDFDQAIEKFYSEIPKMQDHEVIVGFARMVALFGYGHTSLNLNSWRGSPFGFHQLPYNLYHFSDGIYVQGVHQDYKKALGAKVLKIGDTPIEEAIALVKPSFSVENDFFYKAYGMHYLGVAEVLHASKVISDPAKVTMTLEKNGTTFEVDFKPEKASSYPGSYSMFQTQGEWLNARQEGETPLWLKNLDKIYDFQYLPETKTIYVRQSQVMDDPSEPIPAFYDRVFHFIENNEVEKMILDLRLNGGGNNYKNKPVVTGLIKCDKINQPGKLFVITSGKTYSACQNLVNELENYTHAIFIGEPTGEHVNFFGDNRLETLPNSQIQMRLSYLWWQDKDPRDTRLWTPPTLAVDLSFADYQNNHDPIIEAIETYDWSKMPTEQLIEFTQAGSEKEVLKNISDFVKNPLYKYADFESAINDVGYTFINNNNIGAALELFTLNSVLNPKSPNVWDSLAEATLLSGNREKAIELYKKAHSMDPGGFVGENATKMLEQIKKEEMEMKN